MKILSLIVARSQFAKEALMGHAVREKSMAAYWGALRPAL